MARVAVPGPGHDQLQRVRGCLVALLAALWHDGEGFSGKRPFGESAGNGTCTGALVTARPAEGDERR
jgi:hypothetical protein